MIRKITQGLTFDDVLLQPKHSYVVSRKDVSLKSRFIGKNYLDVPIISANMDTVTELEMANGMHTAGGLGIIHRFLTPEKHCGMLAVQMGHRVLSIGVKGFEGGKLDFPEFYDSILIDVAHGDSERVVSLIKLLKTRFPTKFIIAGNVATYDGAMNLLKAGARSIKVGIGPGSVCSTRIITGCGAPQLTAIMEVRRAIDDFCGVHAPFAPNVTLRPTLIADGGIKSSGDIMKALAFGADTVMVGKLFATAQEACGERRLTGEGLMKEYRGMASEAAQKSIGVTRQAEGLSTKLHTYEFPIANLVAELADGLRSGMSYLGCRDMTQLRSAQIDVIQVTNSGLAENRPHALGG